MYNEVANWLNNVLNQDIPEEVVAFCFNLYEDGNNAWSMELVGTERFDVDDEDVIKAIFNKYYSEYDYETFRMMISEFDIDLSDFIDDDDIKAKLYEVINNA